MTNIINLFAGPGAGKSTIAAGLFSEMKWRNINVELVTEFAKDLVWEERDITLSNQIYVTAKQYNRLYRLIDKVDYVITDSPLLLGICYKSIDVPDSFSELVNDMHYSMDSINYFIERIKPYHVEGRPQSEEEAKQLDITIRRMLNFYKVPFRIVKGRRKTIEKILRDLKI